MWQPVVRQNKRARGKSRYFFIDKEAPVAGGRIASIIRPMIYGFGVAGGGVGGVGLAWLAAVSTMMRAFL